MKSEAPTTSDHSPSPTVTELISELKTCFSSFDFQNVAKILMNPEQDLLKKARVLENEIDEILEENKNLNALLKKKDEKIENLERENDGLISEVKKKQSEIEVFEKDEILNENKILSALLKKKAVKIENLEKDNDGLKIEVKKKQSKIQVYEKKVLDFDVRVSSLEKLSKELMGPESFSEVKKAKRIVAESSILPPPPGLKEIPDPKLKKEKESKIPEIITIDDDDDDDHGDHDLMTMYSSKRRRVSSYDDDDDKCISVLKRVNVSKKVTKDHKNTNYNVKIATKTQPKSHLKSPFCDSSGSDSDDEK